ncbi:hypothetical protein SAMN02745724_04765 [Pseudoalteromonas denitrificans DSM 6059]|uniref:Uncharacterized protein n=1 Tax=Pseudoalteromonas denitrificans DSM 6059 TaxID=1123010 RepID=A0A1I1TBB9_9GAMM|nr:hypothetical protein SAMN02745724_04765 [Pseudoalteromonas denitrificans DSM 6059]
MKINLKKKLLKNLSLNTKQLKQDATPQVAGGMYASSPHIKGCISYQGWTCNSLYNCP